jgi:predicted negative regulator of RcsB-dependent stress response
MNNKAIIAYYIIGGLFLAGQAIFTLYQSSQVVHYGQQVAQLEKARHELEVKEQHLSEEIAQANSLSYVANTDLIQDFTLISSTVTVAESNVAALR